MRAVKGDPMVLQFASDELRGDRGVVSAAVQSNGLALQFASPELQADRDVAMQVPVAGVPIRAQVAVEQIPCMGRA